MAGCLCWVSGSWDLSVELQTQTSLRTDKLWLPGILMSPQLFTTSSHSHPLPLFSASGLPSSSPPSSYCSLSSGHQQPHFDQIWWHFITFAAALLGAFDSVDLLEQTRFPGTPTLVCYLSYQASLYAFTSQACLPIFLSSKWAHFANHLHSLPEGSHLLVTGIP